MRLLALELTDFRNHTVARAPLDGESALLLGANGTGKTNWIEAVVLLSVGRSFRGARDRDLIRRGADRFLAGGTVLSRGGVRSEINAIGSSAGPREVRVDGAALSRLAELLGRFPTVHFSVEDLAALNGAPAGRRRFLDVALCQLEPAYVGHLRDYVGALKQRNRLLLDGVGDEDQLGAWEDSLARSGVELDRRRAELVLELDGVLRDLAASLDRSLEPRLGYEAATQGAVGDTVATRAGRLARTRSRDRRLGWTSEGPHRAVVRCEIRGQDLSEGASRGMSRLYSILLRLGLARVLDARLEEPPVVLLDDPESELDPRWIGPLLGLIPETSQVVVTACRPLSAAPARYRLLPIATLAEAPRGARAMDALGVSR